MVGGSRRLAVGLSIVLALVAGACSSARDEGASGATAAPGAGTTTGTTPSSAAGISWSPCGERLECATVPVPLDWQDPGGTTIDLAVIRHRASRSDQRIGTIFADPGGPGDTGVGLVRGAGDDLDAWGDGRFDWIGWDPRGTYASTPVDCFGSEEDAAEFWGDVKVPTTPAASDAYAELTRDLARRCGEVMGDILDHISTTDTVRDLDHMRELLGEETITYVGLSYGTYIGQVYANMFPDRVRAMMLDGIVDPVAHTESAESQIARGTSSTDAVFEQFLVTCEAAGPERCALAGHGETPKVRVARLFEQARHAPIPAPDATPPGELSYGDLLASAFAPLRDPHLWTGYAEQLEAAIEGDPSQLATSAAQTRTVKARNESTKSSAISCLDAPATESVSDWSSVIGGFTEGSTIAGPLLGWWLWAPCASGWPGRSDDRYTGPWDAETEVPILLIGTRYDPNTSYQNAVESEKLLANAVLLTHEGYGHLSSNDTSQCVEAARVRYLVDLEPPASGTICPADQKPFEYGG
jgi:pimeloyl-ACP methyl ester carboxylesterase